MSAIRNWCSGGIGIAALSVASLPLLAQRDSANARTHDRAPTSSVGRILGVFDETSSAPVPDAEVVDVLAEQGYRTQESGLIGLAGFRRQNDSAVVRVRKVGYRDTTMLVMLGAADTVPVQIFLHRVVTLPKVITEAMESKHAIGGMREFEDHFNDKATQGKFATPAQLRKNDSRTLASVLLDLGYPGPRCKGARIFLDGRPVLTLSRTGSTGAVDMNQTVDNYEAIEYYDRAAAPIEYGMCSILLWSRGG